MLDRKDYDFLDLLLSFIAGFFDLGASHTYEDPKPDAQNVYYVLGSREALEQAEVVWNVEKPWLTDQRKEILQGKALAKASFENCWKIGLNRLEIINEVAFGRSC